MKKDRVLYFDVLNIMATFCVIVLHCNYNYFVSFFNQGYIWKFSLFVEIFANWAVPVFFMLTGATLFGYREKYNSKDYFLKRINKTVIPFIAWSIINIVWKTYIGLFSISSFDLKSIFDIFMFNKIEYVYWFFFPLFAIYLCIPVLSLLKNNRKILWYMSAIAFVTQSCLPIMLKTVGLSWNSALDFPMGGGYVLFAILGYLFSTEELSKKQRILIYTLGISSALLIYFATNVLSFRDNATNTLFFNFTYFTSVFFAVAVFVFVKHIYWGWIYKNGSVAKLFNAMSSCAFGIYLVHMLVIYYSQKFVGEFTSSSMWRTLSPVAVYIVSFGAVWLLKRLPFLKRLVP